MIDSECTHLVDLVFNKIADDRIQLNKNLLTFQLLTKNIFKITLSDRFFTLDDWFGNFFVTLPIRKGRCSTTLIVRFSMIHPVKSGKIRQMCPFQINRDMRYINVNQPTFWCVILGMGYILVIHSCQIWKRLALRKMTKSKVFPRVFPQTAHAGNPKGSFNIELLNRK